ncbi:peptidylprolyl isomerase [Desulfosediminicola ganghwensis]|uniref:peptidylprolyl isomerase n=1 Tax=Desulfosediminicola ganghwensis TaxID=2569540 RepID=UPI0010ACE6E4|nr:peptidylprolyl isomerase [Desulfosediminicola ganghwensis]
MRRISVFSAARGVAALICFTFVTLFTTPLPLQAAQLVDKVVAVVNNEIITLSELNEEGKTVFKRIAATTPANQLEDTLMHAREDILDSLIDKRLIAQKAAENHIRVADSEVDAALDSTIRRNGITKEMLLVKLAEAGLDEATYRSTLRSQILQSKLVGAEVHSKIVITEDMIQEHYREQYTSKIANGAYYLLQMGFSWETPDGGDQSSATLYANKADALKRAERIHKLVVAGQDFGALAQKYSDLPSAEDGGDLGTFLLDDMASDMRSAVADLNNGEVSEIIETHSGYQFFKVLSAGEDALVEKASYESVREEIRSALFEVEAERTYEKWVKELKDKAYIQKL